MQPTRPDSPTFYPHNTSTANTMQHRSAVNPQTANRALQSADTSRYLSPSPSALLPYRTSDTVTEPKFSTRADKERRVLDLIEKSSITDAEREELDRLTRELRNPNPQINRIFTRSLQLPSRDPTSPSPSPRNIQENSMLGRRLLLVENESDDENPRKRTSSSEESSTSIPVDTELFDPPASAEIPGREKQQFVRKFKGSEPYHDNPPFSPHWGDAF